MRTFAFFGAKNFEFFNICDVSAQTRGKGLSQFEQEEFILCERLLWMDPYPTLISFEFVNNMRCCRSLSQHKSFVPL